jgi:hypothetical protein
MIMTHFLPLNQHTTMKFTQLNHLKELLTLMTTMVLLKLMTKIGTGSTTMTQLVKFVTSNLLKMMMEN